MAETYDDKAILGAQLETLATDIAMDIAYKDAYDGKWIGIARTGADTVNEEVYWPLFSFTRYADFFSMQLEVDVTNGNFDMDTYETKIIDIGGTNSGVVTWAREVRIYHGKVNSDRGYGNILYYTMSNNVVTVYIKSACKANVTQFCRLNKVVSSNSAVNFTLYSSTSQPTQPSSPTKFTEVLNGLVNVSEYTSYNAIMSVVNAGALPYYSYTVPNTSNTMKLLYAGAYAVPQVGMVIYFEAIVGGTLYHNSFPASGATFTSVATTPLFNADRVLGSSDTSSWSSDDTNVPTRAAVESKISSAMSGSLGGFLGPKSPNDISLYQLSGHTFLKGDWFVVSESGSAYYYPNNDRSASAITLNMLEGEEYYWTSDGHLVVKPNTSLLVYDITSQSDFSNWNDLITSGLYQISKGGQTNAPAAGAFSCLVSNVNGNIRQVAMQSDNIYYRGKGSQSGWTSWRNVNDVDSARDYSPGGTIEQALAARQANIYWWDGANGGTSSNPGATKHYVDSVIQGSWMLTNYDAAMYEIIQNVTGTSIGSGNLPTDYKINASLYYANTAERVVVMGSVSAEMIVPGHMTVSGVYKQMKQRVRYSLTINNTSANGVEIRVCGGGSWAGSADITTANTFLGSVCVDGTVKSTDDLPWTWDHSYKNYLSLGTVPAHGSRTWEIWWKEGTGSSNYKSHDVYVTTIH